MRNVAIVGVTIMLTFDGVPIILQCMRMYPLFNVCGRNIGGVSIVGVPIVQRVLTKQAAYQLFCMYAKCTNCGCNNYSNIVRCTNCSTCVYLR